MCHLHAILCLHGLPSCGSQVCLVSQSETPAEDPAWKVKFLSYGTSYGGGSRPFPESQRIPQNGPAYTLLSHCKKGVKTTETSDFAMLSFVHIIRSLQGSGIWVGQDSLS